ncbi:Proton-coupled folate transporter [Frankliniella fusca]|uniref:Proton-coupled folate transporter n=1 Tax=Frankliniella fusca TaxID=407009 RepID=A0AAE1HTE0_9NEOP|nr:Proton-coupled folate transporter [Frankliniella fusca]
MTKAMRLVPEPVRPVLLGEPCRGHRSSPAADAPAPPGAASSASTTRRPVSAYVLLLVIRYRRDSHSLLQDFQIVPNDFCDPTLSPTTSLCCGSKMAGTVKIDHSNGGVAEMQVQEPDFTWSDMNMRQKAKHVLANVTVEPVILLFAVLSTLGSTASLWLNIGRACSLHLNATSDVCDSLYWGVVDEKTAPYVGQAFTVVTEMQVWQTPLRNSVPILLVLFVGSWADKRHRRKPFLIAPIVGDLLTCIGLLLCYIFYTTPLELAMAIEAVFPAITGALPILLMSVFSYIADVTTVENRTFRIGMVATSFSWGLPIAVAASGPLFEAIGSAPMYILCIVLYAPALAYAVMYIREPRPPVPRPDGVSFLADFFDWKNVWETIKVALKKRRGTRQLQIFLVMALYVCVQGPAHGEGATMSGYQISAFGWGPTDQSLYATYFILVLAAGNIVATTIFSRWLKLHDCTIGIIAMTAKVVVAPLLAWASTTGQFYAVTALDVLTSGAVIALRAVASKLVEFDELGKLMALFAVVEAIIPVFFAPIYSKVYSSTNPITDVAASDTTTASSVLANVTAALTTLPEVESTAATILMENATEDATTVIDIATTTAVNIASVTASAIDNATTNASDMVDAMTTPGHPSAAFLYISCGVSICGLILFAIILVMQKTQSRREAKQDAERDAKTNDFDGGVTNTAFQGDHDHLRARAQNGSGIENTFL